MTVLKEIENLGQIVNSKVFYTSTHFNILNKLQNLPLLHFLRQKQAFVIMECSPFFQYMPSLLTFEFNRLFNQLQCWLSRYVICASEQCHHAHILSRLGLTKVVVGKHQSRLLHRNVKGPITHCQGGLMRHETRERGTAQQQLNTYSLTSNSNRRDQVC